MELLVCDAGQGGRADNNCCSLSPPDGVVPVTGIILHVDGGSQGGDDTSEGDEAKIWPVVNRTFHGTSRASRIRSVSD